MADGAEAYEPDEILEPFFSYDLDTELYSICLISSLDRKVLTLRLDQESVLAFYEKMGDFIEGRLHCEEALLRKQQRRERGI